ncbi:early protein 6 [Lambdapapillomavirus 2]|uniref:Protein E6 n=11 Tax=Papillomaviridae TaxID=151340 RepID=VE6_COPV6|nr:early protein 6 [Lambdapapillomavirus 2]Q89808.1 RecName: Full=Protein E6 [Canine oral papillomavirus (strain Y62)]QBA88843.1 early protein 6 [Canine papillomavirus]AAA61744.1 transforming protein [Lambdapapillomavirus 2]AOI33378.1 putative E6 protein [Lambdapapillomavirus 2]AOI33385.1 putative E6 protein [Lambdapapillomavirus 2]QBA88849.1 early protein 6 [Canine papillomavirus]
MFWGALLSMERPTSVRDLCMSLKLSLLDLSLACKFCGNNITNIEKLLFDKAGFQLIWRENNAFGCCQYCARVCSVVEQCFGSHRHLTSEELVNVTKTLQQLSLRCLGCLSILSEADKELCAELNDFSVVRGKTRGLCSLCRLPP